MKTYRTQNIFQTSANIQTSLDVECLTPNVRDQNGRHNKAPHPNYIHTYKNFEKVYTKHINHANYAKYVDVHIRAA